jgi:hypothetical protein
MISMPSREVVSFQERDRTATTPQGGQDSGDGSPGSGNTRPRGLVYAFLGTVAGDVLRAVSCDVLVVPPASRQKSRASVLAGRAARCGGTLHMELDVRAALSTEVRFQDGSVDRERDPESASLRDLDARRRAAAPLLADVSAGLAVAAHARVRASTRPLRRMRLVRRHAAENG